jgi:ribosomal protein L35
MLSATRAFACARASAHHHVLACARTISLGLRSPALSSACRRLHLGPPIAATAASAVRSTGPVVALLTPRPPPLLHLVVGTRRWLSPGRHRQGGARAQPVKRIIKKANRSNWQLPTKKYKLKSHKGALKRFYLRGDGTFMHKAAGKQHLMAGASRRRQTKRMLNHRPVLARGIVKKLHRLLPYGTTMQPPRKYVQPLFWERTEGWTEAIAASKRPPKAARG